MDSTSPASFSAILDELPQSGMLKNARLEVGKTPSPENGKKAKAIVCDQAVHSGTEPEIELEFERLKNTL